VNRILMQSALKMRGRLLLFTITVTCSAWGALLAFTCGSCELHDSRRTCLGVPPKVTHDRHYWYWSPRCSCQDWDVLLSPRLTFFSSLLNSTAALADCDVHICLGDTTPTALRTISTMEKYSQFRDKGTLRHTCRDNINILLTHHHEQALPSRLFFLSHQHQQASSGLPYPSPSSSCASPSSSASRPSTSASLNGCPSVMQSSTARYG
jgi:hypothetical protein